MTQFEQFSALHQPGKPLLLGNAWDVHSAQLYEQQGYKAIGTSSGAVARILGYEDGEQISFAELFFIVERILRAVKIPVSVDLEAGFGNSIETIVANIERLHDIGVAGINLEDSTNNELVPVEEFGKKLSGIKEALLTKNVDIFINLRTDAFLTTHASPLAITLERIPVYEQAGANGLFVPFVEMPDDIKMLTSATTLPVNVLSVPNLPSFDLLAELGVARISLGSSAFRATSRHFAALIKSVQEQGSVRDLF